jgi:hypothetical protein
MSRAVITYTVDFSTANKTAAQISLGQVNLNAYKTNYAILNAGVWSDVYNSSTHVLTVTSTYDPNYYAQSDLVATYHDMQTVVEEADLDGPTSPYEFTLVIDGVEIIGDYGAGSC